MSIPIAAAAGTVQLSSPNGNNSTIVDTKQTIANFQNISPEAILSVIPEPVKLNHVVNPKETNNEEAKNAAEPAIDLLSENGHLLFFPNFLPTMSAIPSPAAIVDTATTPGRLSRQRSVATINTKVYNKGPSNASLLSP